MFFQDWQDLAQEHHQQLLRDGERERAARLKQSINLPLHQRVMDRMGDVLIALGERLKHGQMVSH